MGAVGKVRLWGICDCMFGGIGSCHRLDLEIVGCEVIVPKNLSDQWSGLNFGACGASAWRMCGIVLTLRKPYRYCASILCRSGRSEVLEVYFAALFNCSVEDSDCSGADRRWTRSGWPLNRGHDDIITCTSKKCAEETKVFELGENNSMSQKCYVLRLSGMEG